jgi:hypothetical protein
MTRFLAPILFAAAAFAQSAPDPFNKPPADVDKALRGRMTEFYQDHVTGQFRKAEELVAEDTKDFFYSSNKPRYLGCEISRIDYSQNFTRARATILCEQNVVMPGFGGVFKLPILSDWKLEDGMWRWFVDQNGTRDTPFGPVKLTPPVDGAPAREIALPAGISLISPEFALHKVTADKNSLALKAGGSGQLTFSNAASGAMAVSCAKTPGFEVTPDRVGLKAGEKATVTVKALAGAPKTSTLNFQVEPTMEQVAVQVTVE